MGFMETLRLGKIYRYIISRYLGGFLENNVDLEQISVDFIKGIATLRDITLSCEV